MASEFVGVVCDAILDAGPLSDIETAQARAALEDTLAVALAGWSQPVVQRCIAAFQADPRPLADGGGTDAPETLAFIEAVASHALDYDDVHMTSVTHPSAVIFPALLALAKDQGLRQRIFPAYAVGLSVNVALGEALGAGHYEAGWHATSTIGAVAGAAAVAHLLGLDASAARSALALGAAQAGGLQRNFGSMAKPVQAGYAAAAAVRAGLLAQAGVTGDQDIFGAKGFLDLYGAGAPVETPVRQRLGTLSVKLYPCCYAAHRLIAAAVQARTQIPEGVPPTATIEVATPFGAMQPLRVSDPQTGAEAQFCAAYAIAVGLSSGGATLADFTDAAAARLDIRALMARISVTEDALVGEPPVGLDHGSVRLTLRDGDRVIASADVAAFPGSPADPASALQLTAKISDCLEAYGQASGRRLSLAAFQATVRRLTGD